MAAGIKNQKCTAAATSTVPQNEDARHSQCIIERTVVHTYVPFISIQRREEIQKHNVKEDNTILLQFRSRDDDEEAAVSSSMMIHIQRQRRSKEQGPYLLILTYK